MHRRRYAHRLQREDVRGRWSILLKILSIRQPWAWLIAHGYKDIENRSWSTAYRGPLLIHAGKTVDHAGCAVVRQRFKIALPEHFETGGIIGLATLTEVVTQSASPWFIGPYGFVLEAARTLPFFPLRGQLGLYAAPAEVLAWLQALEKD